MHPVVIIFSTNLLKSHLTHLVIEHLLSGCDITVIFLFFNAMASLICGLLLLRIRINERH